MADAKISKQELPTSDFIEDVEAFMQGKQVEPVLKGLNDKFSGLKVLEQQLLQRKQKLLQKLPEIVKALDIVTKLLDSQGEKLSMDFEISQHIYTKAQVADVKTVNLWLGANVMVEYELEDAKGLLSTNLLTCRTNLETVNADIDMIKESITTTEVSIARVYNWDVERRRKEKA